LSWRSLRHRPAGVAGADLASPKTHSFGVPHAVVAAWWTRLRAYDSVFKDRGGPGGLRGWGRYSSGPRDDRQARGSYFSKLLFKESRVLSGCCPPGRARRCGASGHAKPGAGQTGALVPAGQKLFTRCPERRPCNC
jgi:hypothetical protein